MIKIVLEQIFTHIELFMLFRQSNVHNFIPVLLERNKKNGNAKPKCHFRQPHIKLGCSRHKAEIKEQYSSRVQISVGIMILRPTIPYLNIHSSKYITVKRHAMLGNGLQVSCVKEV